MFIFSSMQEIHVGFAMNLTSNHRKSFYSNKTYLLYFCIVLWQTISLFTSFEKDSQNIFRDMLIIDDINRVPVWLLKEKNHTEETDHSHIDIFDRDYYKNEFNRAFLFAFVVINFVVTFGIEKLFNFLWKEEINVSQNLQENENEDDE